MIRSQSPAAASFYRLGYPSGGQCRGRFGQLWSRHHLSVSRVHLLRVGALTDGRRRRKDETKPTIRQGKTLLEVKPIRQYDLRFECRINRKIADHNDAARKVFKRSPQIDQRSRENISKKRI